MLDFLAFDYVCIIIKLKLTILSEGKKQQNSNTIKNIRLTKGAIQRKRMPIVSPCP